MVSLCNHLFIFVKCNLVAENDSEIAYICIV